MEVRQEDTVVIVKPVLHIMWQLDYTAIVTRESGVSCSMPLYYLRYSLEQIAVVYLKPEFISSSSNSLEASGLGS